ncbi:MAG TPA: SGNH/GDSL hydrolase family protein [Candidatus Dormibacteraeota bacterium]|nr:SGNH/GDSL hydrolase family protein [Candidatus Dormibacteraeota bacterium]
MVRTVMHAFTFATTTILLSLLSVIMANAQTTDQVQSPAAPITLSPDACLEVPAVKTKIDAFANRLKDWAQLNRYHDANTQLTPPAKSEQRVVFLGDSITDGWSRPEYGGFFPTRPYVNRGISGQTTPQMLVRFRPDVIALQPKAVVILAGTNDIAGNTGPTTVNAIEDNLASIAELAKEHGVNVVLASVLPVSDYGHNSKGEPINQTTRRSPAQILELNAWIKRYAADNGYTYLDYFPAMVDDNGMLKKELSEDGLHPNASGYAIMAPLAEKAIETALKQKHKKKS